MADYVLNRPVAAANYSGPGSVTAVAEIVKKVQTGVSYSTLTGVLQFQNGGRDFAVRDGEWVVDLGSDLAVLDDATFHDVFRSAD